MPNKVFHITDANIVTLAELLQNEKSRNILMLLTKEELYVNQIANHLDLRVSIVVHHLKKMLKLGLLTVTSKPISSKTKDHNFYKIDKPSFVVNLK